MTDAIRDENHVTVALGVSSTDSAVTLPFKIDSATGRLLTNSASGSGDVVGPTSATDDAIATFDGTTGKLLQNTPVTIAQTTGVIAGTEGVTLSGTSSGTTAVVATAAASGILTLPAATDTLVGKATTDTLTNKSIDAEGTGNAITNIGFSELNTYLKSPAWNGWIAATQESVSAVVTEAGSVVTLTVQADPTGDLNVYFSDGITIVDCTPALTIALTQGSDASPQINYIYILKSAPTVLTKSTSGFPTGVEYANIGTYLVQTAATVSTYGVYKAHQWSNEIQATDKNGHVSDLNAWIRAQPATWQSDVALTPTLTPGSPDTLTFATSAGSVLQLHPHTFPAFDSSTGGSTAATTFFVVNDNAGAYNVGKDLYDFKADSDGNAATNNDRIQWVVWGVVSEATGDCKVMVNLPGGFYGSDSAAIADASRYANYQIPSDYIGAGFLIAKLTYKYATSGGGTLTLVEQVDLRGTFPSTSAGGGTASGTTFADNAFEIYDDGDPTKMIAFQASGITTGTTRTITMPDADGTATLLGNSSTGSGDVVLATSPTLVTPALGTPASGALTNCTGLPAAGVVNTAVTLSDTQTITGAKTLGTTGSIKLGSAVTDKCDIQLNDAALNDETWSGTIIGATAGATIAVGDVCYLNTAASEWLLNDGILDGTDSGFKLKLGICVLASTDGNPTEILLDGVVASAAFPTFTVGAPVYLDDTAGDLVVAQPSTTNFAIRVVGEAVSATVLHFHPSNDYIVHV